MSSDIDLIIERMRSAVPDVEITQMHKVHAADDDGLWWFRRPGKSIQIESSSHSLPFLIEHDGGTAALMATTIDDVVHHVVTYLKSQARSGRNSHPHQHVL